MTPFIGQAGNILVPSELLNKVIFFSRKTHMVLWWEVEIVPPQAHDLTTCSPAGDVILEGSGMCRRWGLAGRNESWRASPWRLCLAPCFGHKLCFLAHNVKSPHHTQASSRPCQGELKLGYIFRLCLSSTAVTMTTKQLIIHKGKEKDRRKVNKQR